MPHPKVLIVEQDTERGLAATVSAAIQNTCRVQVTRADPEVVAFWAQSALKQSGEQHAIIFAFTDGQQPALSSTLQRLRAAVDVFPTLLVTAQAPEEHLDRLLSAGVMDFVIPPFHQTEIRSRLRRIIAVHGQPHTLTNRLQTSVGLAGLIGESSAFSQVRERIRVTAQSDAAVLVSGETGTGKEMCARAIHYLGSRATGPFVPVNCGAVPLDLLENELFGHEKAAYTGASAKGAGLISEAEGGTIFLDEVDALVPAAQVKLLRFLQDKEYRPLGSAALRKADVRVIAATNSNVRLAIQSGRLRKDLYYRLGILLIQLPPLRDRREDVPALAEHFALKYSQRSDLSTRHLSHAALLRLVQHDWPGNVRELEHAIQRAVVLNGGKSTIDADDLQMDNVSCAEKLTSFNAAKRNAVQTFERSYIEALLRAYEGNVSRAARAARKNRRAFWELMRKNSIDASPYRERQKHPAGR